MLRKVFQQLLDGSLSRRPFPNSLTQLGVGADNDWHEKYVPKFSS